MMAKSKMQPPLDKFLAFAEALILVNEEQLDAAQAALEQGREVIEQFQLRVLEFQIHAVQAKIAEAGGDFNAVFLVDSDINAHFDVSVLGGYGDSMGAH